MTILYRNYEDISDREEVMDLYIQTFRDSPYYQEFFTKEMVNSFINHCLSAESPLFIVVSIDKRIVGFVWGFEFSHANGKEKNFVRERERNLDFDTAYKIEELAVHREYQNRGIGTSLLKRMLDDIRNRFRKVVILTNVNNREARHIYETILEFRAYKGAILVESARINGEVRVDERVILWKDLEEDIA